MVLLFFYAVTGPQGAAGCENWFAVLLCSMVALPHQLLCLLRV